MERLLTAAPESRLGDVQPLRDQLHIDGARVTTRRAGTTVRRLGPIDICIPAGQRIAVLGKPGSGKTTLLEIIAGTQQLKAGRVLWDGCDLSTDVITTTLNEIAFLPHNPTWPRRRVGELLDADGGDVDADTRKLFRLCGATSLLKRLPKGLDTKVASADLSPRERVALALASLARREASLWLLDDPAGGLEKRKARRLIKRILHARTGDTVVVTLSRPVRLGKFDRVIMLKRGKVAFDGTPDEWRVASKVKSTSKSEKHDEPAAMGGQAGGES
ncbi:MAG: ATP-binding cassette domain-containing protein [Planctomycetes bacterium]|nr:ATP-binding cassette domain-containing protein [Planctomycetota bacterium]